MELNLTITGDLDSGTYTIVLTKRLQRVPTMMALQMRRSLQPMIMVPCEERKDWCRDIGATQDTVDVLRGFCHDEPEFGSESKGGIYQNGESHSNSSVTLFSCT
jgi:hypothetical protein